MLREKSLDKATIDTYHAWVQQGIRNDLNSLSLGPGRQPFQAAIGMFVFGGMCLLVGVLLIALRMRHVYLWDWDAQFLGPFFFIAFLLCMAGGMYLIVIAKRRSNKYRSQLYFKPLGDWGVSCVHTFDLVHEDEAKHELKSGTTPHKTVKPRSEAYSQSTKDGHRARIREGRDNAAYDKSPLDANKPLHRPDGRRGPDGRRPPHPDGRRGPPPDRRGPPPDRRGPPPERRPGPPPDRRPGPPREVRIASDDSRDPPPEYRRSPPGDRRQAPPRGGARIPEDGQGRRPRGVPQFGGVEVIPDDQRQAVQLITDKSRESESDI